MSTLVVVRQAFERAGVEFIDENGGGPGVRLRKRQRLKKPNLQDLRRRIYVKAKAETTWRFWGLYVHVCKMETLRAAYALAEKNDGLRE